MPKPKKSIAELKASGSYRPNKHGRTEDMPELPIEAPRMPHFVSVNALEYFNDVVALGIDMSIVTKADSLIIGLLASEIAEWVELDTHIKKEGFIVKLPTATGFMQSTVNPKLRVRDDKLKVILKMLSELGMTPAARSKVKVNQKSKEQKSALGEFLAAATKRMNA